MRERLLVVAALAVVAAGCWVHAMAGYSAYDLSGHALGCDDAWISFRYARHLAEGHGLVFNPGGERVEGFSNLLYVLVMALGIKLFGPDPVYPLSVTINTACAVLAGGLFWRHVRSRLGPRAAAWGVSLFALSPMIWLWAASGLETAVVLLFQLAIWFAVERTREEDTPRAAVYLAVWCVGLVVLRADGFLVPLLAVVYLALHRRLRRCVELLAVVVVAQGILTAGRFAYYGDVLPNTYYAKVSGPLLERVADGVEKLGQIAMSGGLFAGLLALGLATAVLLRGRDLTRLRFPVLFGVAWLGYWLFIGGDHFFERFLLPLYPMGAFLALQLLEEGKVRAPVWTFVGLLLVGLQLGPLAIDPRCDYGGEAKYDRWVELGRYLGETYPGRKLATDAAGKLPWFSGLETIDTLGLNDRHIARVPVERFRSGHSKHDAPYVLAREPDIIAGWIEPTLDLRYGMDRDLTRPLGYRVTHLVNTSARSVEPNIVNTRGKARRDIVLLIASGYGYGVLVRGPAPEGDP